MPLSYQQEKLIVDVDSKAKAILANGGNEKMLLIEMLDFMPDIKTIITSVPRKEMDTLVQKYDGFYAYMKVLENLAQKIANGDISVP